MRLRLKTSLLPASAKVSVNANQSYKLIRLSLSESRFGIEVIGFIGQHLEITVGSASIVHLRQTCRIFGRERQLLLVLAELPIFVILSQRLRDSAKSLLDRLLISQDHFLLARLTELDAGKNPSPFEDGLDQ